MMTLSRFCLVWDGIRAGHVKFDAIEPYETWRRGDSDPPPAPLLKRRGEAKIAAGTHGSARTNQEEEAMICVLCLLILAGVSWGQPVDGPWVISEVDTTIALGSPHITMVDDSTARLFWVAHSGTGSEIRTQRFDVHTHALVEGPEMARADSLPLRVVSAMGDGPDRWVLSFVREHPGTGSELYCAVSGSVGVRDYQLGESHDGGIWFPSTGYSTPQLAPRMGGGWVMCWTDYSCGGPYGECSSLIQFAALLDSIEYLTTPGTDQYLLFGPYDCYPWSYSADTSWVLVPWLELGTGDATLLRTWRGADPAAIDIACEWDCAIGIGSEFGSAFGVSHDGRMVLWASYAQWNNRLWQLDCEGGCEQIAALDDNRSPQLTAFHGSFGFAGLWISPSSLQLARLSPYGDSREPGVFYWRDTEHVIAEADPVVMNDGRIFVVWTERDETRANATRMLIGGISWDTPLAADELRAVPAPRALTLTTYPNPFNSDLLIDYALPQAGDVNVTVYDVLGRAVATLADGRVNAGTQHANWKPTGATGIYFVTVRSGMRMETRKVLYLR
jgi:hypothetical protein